MARTDLRAAAALFTLGLLAGCSSEPAGSPGAAPAAGSPAGSAAGSAAPDPSSPGASSPGAAPAGGSPSPAGASPSTTLSAAQQEAFEQATAVVMAYNQAYTDLYTGARTRINDLDDYATGDKLDRDRTNVMKGLAAGRRTEPLGAQLVLVSAEPVEVALAADPAAVVVRACIDFTAGTDVLADGSRIPGVREELDYTVVRTTYLPAPGWAVADMYGAADPEDRAC